MLELIDESLKIYASNGLLTVWADQYPDRISELPLSKLEKIYRRWQHIIKELPENIAQTLLNDKQKREEIFSLLRAIGFKRYQHFTASQIKALLCFYKGGHSIIWLFHTIYPVLELPETNERPIDFNKYLPNLDPFELAQYYLLQNNSLHLIEDMPLSKIMKLFVTRNFISWISDPKNREALANKEFEEFVDANPMNPEDVLAMMKKGPNQK